MCLIFYNQSSDDNLRVYLCARSESCSIAIMQQNKNNIKKLYNIAVVHGNAQMLSNMVE